MKNLSLIANIVLALAVAILFYLHFSSGAQPSESPLAATLPASSAGVAYVNSDSLLNGYEYFKQIKKDLEEKSKRAEKDLLSKQTALQREFQAYQQNAAGMTMEQRQKTEESLMRKEQQFREYSQTAGMQLQEEEAKLNEQLYAKVSGYLKKHSEGKSYRLIFGYSKTGNILYASDTLDITSAVLKGLNEEYKKEK